MILGSDEKSPEPAFDFDLHWMGRAFEQASQAATRNEVPVGAVVVKDGMAIAESGNQCIALKDPTAHAEMLSITQAAAAVGDWRLQGTVMYITLEPCLMCAGAILQARIPRIVFGAAEPKGGAVVSMYQVLSDKRLNHSCEITSGVMAEPCGNILTEFFASQRALGKK